MSAPLNLVLELRPQRGERFRLPVQKEVDLDSVRLGAGSIVWVEAVPMSRSSVNEFAQAMLLHIQLSLPWQCVGCYSGDALLYNQETRKARLFSMKEAVDLSSLGLGVA
eukprot:scaffold4697_cov277-Prasinococcus_capsulatus_cf.AAC.3